MGPREHDVLRELELSARSASQDAPFYQIPSRTVSAVEHPMVVLDNEKAMKMFGSSFNFHTVSYLAAWPSCTCRAKAVSPGSGPREPPVVGALVSAL